MLCMGFLGVGQSENLGKKANHQIQDLMRDKHTLVHVATFPAWTKILKL